MEVANFHLGAGFCGYSVKFSPFDESMLAVGSAQHYGIVGNGRVSALRFRDGSLSSEASFLTQDGVFDLAWSECDSDHVLAACGDGSLKLFSLSSTAAAGGRPLRSWCFHTAEVYGVDWDGVGKRHFASASWDHAVALWDVEAAEPLRAWREHAYLVYGVSMSPHRAGVLATASGDTTVRVFDAKAPRAVATLPTGGGEVLSVDWGKYAEDVVATASVDKTVRVWDLRQTRQPKAELRGHAYAARRVRWSPHAEDRLASASYDLTCCVWALQHPVDPLLCRLEQHSEFVVGVDWALFQPGVLATTAWDETVKVFNI